MLSKDRVILGLLPGIVLPILLLEIWHRVNFPQYTAYDFLVYIETFKFLAPALSLVLLFNLGLFFLFLNRNKFRAGTGVILATFLYAGVIVWAKFWGF